MRHTLSDINLETRRATCSVCGPDVKLKKQYGENLGRFRCKVSWESTEKKRVRSPNHTFYVNKAIIEEIRVEQQNRCAICKEEKPLVVDHCHERLVVRGLLCQACNKALGFFRDNVQSLLAAVEYLQSCP